MVRACYFLAATLALIACPAPQKPPAIAVVDDTGVRIRVARAEARRGAGVDELVELARHGATNERVLALRGLGRSGGAKAIALVRELIADRDPAIASAAISALAIAVTLEDTPPAPKPKGDDPSAPLVAALLRRDLDAAVVLEAIGRVGEDSTMVSPLLAMAMQKPATAEAAALAAGRLGRRKIPITTELRDALVVATRDANPAVRYAAVYGLAREVLSGKEMGAAAVDALAARIADDQPEIRAQAIFALGKRLSGEAAARKAIEDSLRDRDWRVAVEAVRVLAGEHGDDAGRDVAAAALLRRYAELDRGAAGDAHIVLEGLRLLADHGKRPLVASVLGSLATSTSTTIPALTRGWIECLAIAAIQRAAATPDYDAVAHCGQGNLPDHLRLPLLGDLVTAGAGDLAARRRALGTLLAHGDARVRAAGLGTLASMWKAGDTGDHRLAITTLIAALGSSDAVVAGSAVDAASGVYDAIGAAPDPDRAALDAAIVARATTERDPELSGSLFEVVGKRAIAAGAPACRAALASDPVRAKAARACLASLGEAPPVTEPAANTPPPVDVATVIGKHPSWHLVTSRGEIVIALDPSIAPWAVATIVALTRRGFYDGLELHRVVPNFVAQGGDPTMSGAGGPGFTIPAEPGGAFTAGGIGIADAGKDSGGSQWFVMHSNAPHLGGRYTWVGRVESGQKSADALQIGDRVERATIEIR